MQKLWQEVRAELASYMQPPRTMINSLFINSLISIAFFLSSYLLGTYNPALLPIAAATILLWTLADTSVCNQFLFDKHKSAMSLKQYGSLKRYLLVKNLSVVALTLPMTLLYGLFLVMIVGKWHELFYGVIAALTLIWGWLGISNALSASLPYEILDIKTYAKSKHRWIGYGLLYSLPWILLPFYAILVALPFMALGWTKADASLEHRAISLAVLFITSIGIWILGLHIASKQTAHPSSKVAKLLLQ